MESVSSLRTGQTSTSGKSRHPAQGVEVAEYEPGPHAQGVQVQYPGVGGDYELAGGGPEARGREVRRADYITCFHSVPLWL